MKHHDGLKRFNIYQKERFPFVVLIFTTLSVVLSSSAVVLGQDFNLINLWKPILIGTITCLLFMFSIRVFDDYKDIHFDNKYYKDRPVQRGLISLSELNKINFVSLIFQGIINITYSVYTFLIWIIALIYSLVARHEFFLGNILRKRFIIYNLLNLLQIFFLQIYLYFLIAPGFSFNNILLIIHFVFVLVNASVLEVARKIKGKEDESKGLDTYSGRYGVFKASIIYLSICLSSFILFLVMFFNLSDHIWVLFASIIAFLIVVTSLIYYYLNRNKLSSKILEGCAIIFYLAMHLLLLCAVI